MTTTQSQPIPDPLDLLPLPSDAVSAMIDGLKAADLDPGCEIDMNTYGHMKQNICFGCAATYAVRSVAKAHNLFTPINHGYRRRTLSYRWKDFEYMINSLRFGCSSSLYHFYRIQYIKPSVTLPEMSNYNWREGLPAYEAYRDQLRSLGH